MTGASGVMAGASGVMGAAAEPARTAALRCPDWPVTAARRRDPSLVAVPVVVVDRGQRGLRVVAASAEARAEGVVCGLRRREAEARCAGLMVLDADEAGDARAFEEVARAIEQSVPHLVLHEPGALSFATRGPSRYFGGDDALAALVVETVAGLGITDATVGIAAGVFAADLAASRALVVPPGGTVAFLTEWPVSVLAGSVDASYEEGDGGALVDLFARLGLRTLGDLAALPESAVAARFGPPGLLAHRLARGEPGHEPVARAVPPELVEVMELDPPATRVDEAAFAAKALADRLLGRLDAMGCCCTRVVVEAETEHGERLTRCWRHEGALTPSTLVARVRWQLEAWLVASDAGVAAPGATVDDAAAAEMVTGGLTVLRLAPDDVIPATGRQLGFWGGDPAAADRAGRALARVQALLGPDAVATALPVGGRTPLERVRWVPWGDARDDGPDASPGAAPWPGAVPGPAPARVFDPPVPAALLDAQGEPVTVSGRGETSAAPAVLECPALPGGGGPLVAWAGPWAHDLRWWSQRRRRVLWQVVVDARRTQGQAQGRAQVACLVAVERGRAAVEALYD
jgi:protein ImuB